MIDSGEHDAPLSPLEMALNVQDALDTIYDRLCNRIGHADLWEIACTHRKTARQLVNALTPPPAALAPTAHEPIDWSEATNN